MGSRTYGQPCTVARALDVIGERWTLLLVRELLLGPKRFTDLLSALPSMGSNRLGDRLKTLRDAGVVTKRTLPPPAAVQVYELTDYGEQLRTAIYCLGAWGRQLPTPAGSIRESARAELIALVLAGTSPSHLTAGLSEMYEFHVGEEQFHVRIHGGEAAARSGPAPVAPELVVDCTRDTFLALVGGDLTASAAARRGDVSFTGEPATLARAFEILNFGNSGERMRLIPA